ncbi:hypothetical protein EVAR_63277_1 [Eumeta japonica]|uniref:Uncharacterized protein n=1 Tax=Eumeta variegata TaxID=151549 RepID=A0A4C1Z1P2_EUMVA|nr:hypothetical protein EVAR_63277_1 [Eumeta japonica]
MCYGKNRARSLLVRSDSNVTNTQKEATNGHNSQNLGSGIEVIPWQSRDFVIILESLSRASTCKRERRRRSRRYRRPRAVAMATRRLDTGRG